MSSKIIKFVLLWFLSLSCFAQIKVEVRPQKPIKEETFSVLFKISTVSDEEPYISFSPSGVEVQGRQREGVSVQATMINGKFTSRRQVP